MEQPKGRAAQLATALIALVLFGVVILWLAKGSATEADFGAVYTAGYMVSHGETRRLYDLQEQAVLEKQLLHRSVWLPITHPPFEALLFVPLSLLPYAQAYLIWGALNIFVWLYWAWLLRPHAPVPESDVEYLLLCIVFFPAWNVLIQGQTSFVLLLLYTLAFISLKQGKPYRAGAFLAMGLLKFQFILPLGLIFLLRRQWKVLATLAAGGAGLAGISLAMVGRSGLAAYLDLLNRFAQHAGDPAYAVSIQRRMMGARAFFTVTTSSLFSPAGITATVTVFSILFILFAALWWNREVAQSSRFSNSAALPATLARAFSVAVLVSLMTAPHFNIHDLTMALLPLLLILGQSPERSSWSPLSLVAAALFFPITYILLFMADAIYMLFPIVAAFVLAAIFERRQARDWFTDSLVH